MTHALRSAAVASLAALAALAALLAADLTPPVQAQSEDETTGRIVARRLANGRVEFGWQTPSGARVLPKSRYFPAPADATVDRWLRSSPVEVGGVAIGRINARLRADGRIEFAFTPTDGERVLPQSRNFPADARVGRWLRSTEITIAAPAPRYIAVSAGYAHTCAIRSDGEIECWGDNERGQSDPPPGSFRAIDAGNYYTCGLRENGAIECWGGDYSISVHTPTGRSTAVSGGGFHACAIRSTGAIECWGHDPPFGLGHGVTDAPDGNFRAVGAGLWHSCGVRTSGGIACWGENGIGQAEDQTGNYTAVSAGDAFTCGLRSDGAITCWGGRFRDGRSDPPSGRFRAISTGEEHACGLRENGAITCWGRNNYGQINAPSGKLPRYQRRQLPQLCNPQRRGD